jgi:hypothetical protein
LPSGSSRKTRDSVQPTEPTGISAIVFFLATPPLPDGLSYMLVPRRGSSASPAARAGHEPGTRSGSWPGRSVAADGVGDLAGVHVVGGLVLEPGPGGRGLRPHGFGERKALLLEQARPRVARQQFLAPDRGDSSGVRSQTVTVTSRGPLEVLPGRSGKPEVPAAKATSSGDSRIGSTGQSHEADNAQHI